jgi:excinuclease ABC subunit C
MLKSSQYSLDEINSLPSDPGVYCFHNKHNKIIYVGKAKDLKKRVSSYFTESKQHSIKTQKLASEISTIEITIVNSEYEALLLENNLIKSNQPRYNILLKDDKTYPYICVTNERFPRLTTQRNPDAKLGKVYGPFTSSKVMYQILELIKEICPLRTCSYNLSEKNIVDNKFKVCLEYHLKNCMGPCVGYQKENEYITSIERAIDLLKGNFSEVKRDLKEKMLLSAHNLAYEQAELYKKKLESIEAYQAKSIIINPTLGNIDVFGITTENENVFVNYMQIINGAIAFAKTIEVVKKLDEDLEEILPTIIFELTTKYNSPAQELISNVGINTEVARIKTSIPQIGDKKKLVLLAMKNALSAKQEFINRDRENDAKVSETLKILQHDLMLSELPLHIECFDNSNLLGTNPVSAMVCFKNGKPAKKFYRHYNIKTVIGADDFASMYEVVFRRYKNAIEEDTIPNLILIDGGKGQLSSAIEALKVVGLYGRVAIVAIAKRLEEIYYPNDPHPVHISKKSPALKLLQRIRNEAHRFAIEFHRKKRSESSLKSTLEEIDGLGPKTIEKLLQEFHHLDNIRLASLDQISDIIGNKKAQILQKAMKG